MTVIDEIKAERERQQSVEGWTLEHDDQHTDGEIARAAAAYALQAGTWQWASSYRPCTERRPPSWWSWASSWWKPKGARRDLIRAGALIVAEIERLDRKATNSPRQFEEPRSGDEATAEQ